VTEALYEGENGRACGALVDTSTESEAVLLSGREKVQFLSYLQGGTGMDWPFDLIAERVTA